MNIPRLCALVALLCSPSMALARPSGDIAVAGARPHAEISFPCAELQCRGSLFLPDSSPTDRPPVIVMAHGLTVPREYLALQASRFAQAGFAVFTFDYRSFGGSEGTPRFDVSAERQLDDWRAAIRFVQDRSDLDGARLAIWGSSYSGGHVLALASERKDIRAVVAQVPYVGGSVEDERGFWFLPKALAALTLDAMLRPFGRAFYVDVAGDPGVLAGITVPEEKAALERFIASVPESSWRNRMPARVLYRVATYVPDVRPTEIDCPVLMYAATRDKITPPGATRDLAAQLPDAELRIVDGGHFGIYEDPTLSEIIEEEIAFFERALRADSHPPGSPPP